MKNVFDQLNLRPQERRVVVVVFILVFVVLNWIFVFPIFGKFGESQNELAKAERTQRKYQDEIAKEKTYRSLETKLKSEGSDVLTEELQLQRIIDQHATAAGFTPGRWAPGVRVAGGRTNQFFEDQGMTIDVNTYSTNLVEFLVAMASDNSMIRVQEMNLKPDPSGQKLSGSLLFVASYQKKASARPTVAPTSGSKPVSTANAPKTSTAKPTTTASASKTNAAPKLTSQPKLTTPPGPKISTNKAAKK